MTAPSTSLARLISSGLVMTIVAFVGLLLPGNVFAYPRPIDGDQAILTIYAFSGGHTLLAVTLATLAAGFLTAVSSAAHLDGRRATIAALAVSAVLIAVYVPVHPAGSLDIFHNLADARTLWTYGQNPAVVPPAAHLSDPIMRAALAWQSLASYYGPVSYAVYGIPATIAGASLQANLIAFKAFNGVLLLLMAALAAYSSRLIAPGRATQAAVLIGWNPLLLYEVVGNGHNDIIMMLPVMAGLALACRSAHTRSLLLIALGTGAKYVTGPVGVLTWIWFWLRGGRRERLILGGLAGLGALGALGFYLLWVAPLLDTRRALEANPLQYHLGVVPFLSPLAFSVELLRWYFPYQTASSLARDLSFGAALLLAALACLRLNTSHRSLYSVSFWLLAVITLLIPGQVYPSYLVWFVPLGAVLAGTTPSRVAIAASVAGTLSVMRFLHQDYWQPGEEIR